MGRPSKLAPQKTATCDRSTHPYKGLPNRGCSSTSSAAMSYSGTERDTSSIVAPVVPLWRQREPSGAWCILRVSTPLRWITWIPGPKMAPEAPKLSGLESLLDPFRPAAASKDSSGVDFSSNAATCRGPQAVLPCRVPQRPRTGGRAFSRRQCVYKTVPGPRSISILFLKFDPKLFSNQSTFLLLTRPTCFFIPLKAKVSQPTYTTLPLIRTTKSHTCF